MVQSLLAPRLATIFQDRLLSHSLNVVTNILHISTQHNEDNDLQRFWDLEMTGTAAENNSDKQFLLGYSKTCITRLPDGSYCTRFPWKENHPPLPTNSNICRKRIRSLANWLSQTPGLLQTYNSIICDQLNRDFIERVYTPEKPGLTHFIPHYCVKKNLITTSIRIMYDCSCHQSKDYPSLNDCLLIGPHSLNDLCQSSSISVHTTTPFLPILKRHFSTFNSTRVIEIAPAFSGSVIPQIPTVTSSCTDSRQSSL